MFVESVRVICMYRREDARKEHSIRIYITDFTGEHWTSK